MNIDELYKILGVSQDATVDEIENAYNAKINEIYINRNSGIMDAEKADAELEKLHNTYTKVLENAYNAAAAKETGATIGKTSTSLVPYTGKPEKNKKGVGIRILAGVMAIVVAGGIVWYALYLNRNHNQSTTSKPTTSDSSSTSDSNTSNSSTSSSEENKTPVEGIDNNLPEVVHYADINDEAVVQERANTLVKELKALNIVNPSTGSLYSADEVVTLIKYANGVYVPETMEEIDVLHLNLLNLLTSPLNTDEYLYHVVYASGNDEFKDIASEAVKNIKPINFGTAFTEYEENGVYPLTVWMQQKREEIYSTTNREKINKIFIEVGQVMADLMKGNGCTITIDKDNQECTYTYTREQILANHASAMLLTIDAELILANHYEIRDDEDVVIDSVKTVWQVYNKFNGDEPDQVSLEEIQVWINNGCDYEWGIDEILMDGQTFGQRIQGDMEGIALNNFTMKQGKRKALLNN